MEGDEKVHTRNSIFWDNSYNEKTSLNIVNFRGAISVRYHIQTVKTTLASEITIHRMIKMFQKKKKIGRIKLVGLSTERPKYCLAVLYFICIASLPVNSWYWSIF